VSPAELPDRIEQLQQQLKGLRDEAEAARAREAVAEAAALAREADEGVVAARRDGLDPGDLRRLALATRDTLGSGVVALVGVGPDGKKAGIAVAVTKEHVERGVSAADVAAKAAKALGGGTAKSADVVSGGGPNVDAVDEALALVRTHATEAVAGAPR
jgi:alanyl-tRNA synthetase